MVFAIHQYESVIGIHVSLPSRTVLATPTTPYASRLSQSTSFGSLASYIKIALVIYFTYGNVCVAMLFSQIIPPPLPSTDSKCLFLCLCLLCCPDLFVDPLVVQLCAV